MTKFQIWGRGALTVGGVWSQNWECKISLVSGVGAIVLCTSESGNAQLGPNHDEKKVWAVWRPPEAWGFGPGPARPVG